MRPFEGGPSDRRYACPGWTFRHLSARRAGRRGPGGATARLLLKTGEETERQVTTREIRPGTISEPHKAHPRRYAPDARHRYSLNCRFGATTGNDHLLL
jgi:hypothetical protein